SRSAGSNPRSRQASSPDPTSPSIAGVALGETTTTSAPAAIRAGRRRCATWPPPTTTTRRPESRRPDGYGGKSATLTLLVRDAGRVEGGHLPEGGPGGLHERERQQGSGALTEPQVEVDQRA